MTLDDKTLCDGWQEGSGLEYHGQPCNEALKGKGRFKYFSTAILKLKTFSIVPLQDDLLPIEEAVPRPGLFYDVNEALVLTVIVLALIIINLTIVLFCIAYSRYSIYFARNSGVIEFDLRSHTAGQEQQTEM